jgi:CheY-like chemotaxis protein
MLTGGSWVDSAPNGVAALEKFRHQRYDLILSDLHMPHVNGFGLYLALTQHVDRLSERIIFLPRSTRSSELHRFLKETGLPVLWTPFALVELQQLVHQVLAANHVSDVASARRCDASRDRTCRAVGNKARTCGARRRWHWSS